jgi:phosphopantothenoylcysteine decarboxylase/phosphopantothenate--cysteine ligase
VNVKSAQNMLLAGVKYANYATIFIASAAVADWRPATSADQKLKKDGTGVVPQLSFVENPDILATIAQSERGKKGLSGMPDGLFCVGFAAESQDLLANAQAKRVRKGVPLLVGNIGPATFGQDDNALLLVDAKTVKELPEHGKKASKRHLAQQLVADIAARLGRSA